MEQKNTIHDILSQREEFLVIGLTGRVGSGCSKVAQVLATPYEKMNFPDPKPQSGLRSLTEEERITRIIAEYAEAHWIKFDVIQAGAIIATFILDNDQCFIKDLASRPGTNGEDQRHQFRVELLKKVYTSAIALYIKTFGLDEAFWKKKYILDGQQSTDDVENEGLYITLHQDVQFKKILIDEPYIKRQIDLLDSIIVELVDHITAEELLEKIDLTAFKDACTQLFRCSNRNDTQNDTKIWKEIGKTMNKLYRLVPQENPKIHRRKYFSSVDKLLELFSTHYLIKNLNDIMQKDAPETKLWTWMQKIDKSIQLAEDAEEAAPQIENYIFVKYLTTWFGKAIREYVAENLGDDAYARLFQRYGQMIRYDGEMKIYEDSEAQDLQENRSDGREAQETTLKRDIFAIPRKINQHIKVLRHPFDSKNHRPVRIVVDSIKNIFEAVYLRYRYSAFYLWAITTDTLVRERRLSDKHFNDIQVEMLDWNEYPDKGRDVILKADDVITHAFLESESTDKLTPEDKTKWSQICDVLLKNLKRSEVEFYLGKFSSKISKAKAEEDTSTSYTQYDVFDKIRREFFRNGTHVFYTQDIDSCVCNADVYLFNNATSETDIENNSRLLEAVVRNVSLAMYPCLVRPTPVERCMQIALSAKVNSGCLSRQVGAVVTDAQYNILAIGWNDVPCGEVPCAYKNFTDICSSADQDAYSDYELHNMDFRNRLAKYAKIYGTQNVNLRGLPFNYCFKDIHKKGKDPMRSRAMHAEEKALALCGREAEGGYLFTTSSPCEMCSKNAKNHKIKKIFYLEAYPGISQAQYTNSGDRDNRAELILFSGAVGRAYMQMYTPLLPHKDVLEYLGIDFKKDPSNPKGNQK